MSKRTKARVFSFDFWLVDTAASIIQNVEAVLRDRLGDDYSKFAPRIKIRKAQLQGVAADPTWGIAKVHCSDLHTYNTLKDRFQ